MGKSTTSLALLAGLIKRKGVDSVGFMKPVGQTTLTIEGHMVDKDVPLMKEFFGLKCEYKNMSPILIPKGYTKRFVCYIPKMHPASDFNRSRDSIVFVSISL